LSCSNKTYRIESKFHCCEKEDALTRTYSYDYTETSDRSVFFKIELARTVKIKKNNIVKVGYFI